SRAPHQTTLMPYTTLFRSGEAGAGKYAAVGLAVAQVRIREPGAVHDAETEIGLAQPGAAQVQSPRLQAGEIALEQVAAGAAGPRSEEHTSELQSREKLVCR